MGKLTSLSVAKAGCIPIRERRGRRELCLINSRNTPGQWIYPKGNVEFGEKLIQAASRETFEEAGLAGKVIKAPILLDCNGKLVKSSSAKSCYFPMLVMIEEEHWPEVEFRERIWISYKKLTRKAEKDPNFFLLNMLAKQALRQLN